MVVVRGWGEGERGCALTGKMKRFWGRMVAMVAQQCDRLMPRFYLHIKMVEMVHFTLRAFYSIKKQLV